MELVISEREESVKTEIVNRPNQRTRFKLLRDTVKCEILSSNLKNKNIKPLFKAIQPGGGSSSSLYSQEGEEFEIVLNGSMQLTAEEKVLFLKQEIHFILSPLGNMAIKIFRTKYVNI